MSRQHRNRPGVPRISRLAFTILLAIPLALLALVPLSGRAAAQTRAPDASGAPAHAVFASLPHTSQAGKSSGPAMDITLHYHSTVGGGDFGYPYRMGTDAQGELFVADLTLDRVLMFDANDSFVRYFGTGTNSANPGDFNGPEGITVSGSSVFIADFGNHRIQVFAKSTGAYVTEFGDGNLVHPYGMTLASNGQLYVADGGNNLISRFTTAGVYQGSFGGAGNGNGQFNTPQGVAASALGYIYVTDYNNHRVQQFNLSGTYLNQWGSASFTAPDGIAVDRANMVYVTDRGSWTIYKFDSGGSFVGSYAAPPTTPFVVGTFGTPGDVAVRSIPNKPIAVIVSDQTASGGVVQHFDQVINPQYHDYQAQWGTTGSGNGQFSSPWATAVDNQGNVYVTDENNNRVEKFDQFGNFQFAFGGTGSGNGQLHIPTGIAISPDGTTLYVADYLNDRIEEFNTSGSYLGQFGSNGNGDGQFAGPEAVASDGSYLYVADTGNNRIEVFATNGTFGYQFGSLGSGTLNFNAPAGIAVDIARQELFIADFNNNRVQVYTTGGTFINSVVVVGSGTFNGPQGVATDQRGDVYVTDTGNNRIYQMDVNITRYEVFGSLGSGNGQFNVPRGIAVSPTNGQLYIADLGNNRVQRFGSPWLKYDTIGIYRPSTKTFYLRTQNSTGPANITVYMPYAQSGDLPIVGDWGGTGVDTVGLYRSSTGNFLLQDANVQESAPDYVFTLGVPGDTPIAGDWNGDGTDGAGIFRPSNGILYLKNQLSTGYSDDNLVLGVPGDKGIAGDWNGDGQDSPGVYRPSNQTFYVTNKVTNGVVFSDATATLGLSGDAPFTGDWVAQVSSGIGVFRPSNGVTYEKNDVSTGFADNSFIYGIAGDIPVAGQWIALQLLFSAPAPHVSLGTRGAALHPASGAGHAPAPGHTAAGGQTPAATPRRSVARTTSPAR